MSSRCRTTSIAPTAHVAWQAPTAGMPRRVGTLTLSAVAVGHPGGPPRNSLPATPASTTPPHAPATRPYTSEIGPPWPPSNCKPQTVHQPSGFACAERPTSRRPEFTQPSQPVDSGDWAGVVCLRCRVPLFDEYADALTAEFQEIAYLIHATHWRAPPEFLDGPVPGCYPAMVPMRAIVSRGTSCRYRKYRCKR